MVALRVPRKQLLWVGIGVLVLLLIAVVVLTRLSKPADGRLTHDDTLRSSRIDKVWRVEKPRLERCLVIRLNGDITGNARSTWGLTGPVTVWEHMRFHDAVLSVEAQAMTSNGDCGDPVTVQGMHLQLLKLTDDGGSRRLGHLGGKFDTGRGASIDSEGFVGRLPGRTHDRGESYEAALGVYVDPTWDKRDNVSGDGAQVDATFELAADD